MPTETPVHSPAEQQPLSLRLDGRPLATAVDVARYLNVDISEMLRLLYKAPADERYRHFEIPKRSGGMRQISAPHGQNCTRYALSNRQTKNCRDF